jgi:histidyl-tRNA synthetase
MEQIMNKKLIQPKVLKGFRDYLPELMLNRKKMINKIENIFESHGFAPIDTPALEYTEILMGKGGDESDKQLFRFNDNGGRDVTLRFDLTVPLARFVSQYYNELGMPFKAYHIAPVWRGENTHKGRYREFLQCDFDILGTSSNLSDIEIGTVIYSSLKSILGTEDFTIRINNRMILNGLMQKFNLEDKTTAILRVIDKMNKVPLDNIKQELNEKVGLSGNQVDVLLSFIQLKGSNQEIINDLKNQFDGNEFAQQGVKNLEEFIESFSALGIPEKCYQLDLSIARGLDYYTGPIFETLLTNLPGIGSVCSGGRYDNLAELYTTNHIPGVGASIGLDRLIAAMEELNMLDNISTPAQVLILNMDNNYKNEYLKLANELRVSGIKTELYTEDKKLDKQLKYANRKGFKLIITNASNEFETNMIKIKNMVTGENIFTGKNTLIEIIQKFL